MMLQRTEQLVCRSVPDVNRLCSLDSEMQLADNSGDSFVHNEQVVDLLFDYTWRMHQKAFEQR